MRSKGRASLDEVQVSRNLKAVATARSRLFACLALLLLAMVGVLAVDHCHCDDVTADCEHAGAVCSQTDDCPDCLVPTDPAPLFDAAVALPPAANALVGAPLLVPVFAYAERSAAGTVRAIFIPRSSACRPPALRAGTMSLRV